MSDKLIAAGLLLLAVVIPLALTLIFLLRLALRSHSSQVMTGATGMIGMTGRAETALAPEGTVLVRGELWRARSTFKVAPGEGVRILGVDGLTLEVEPADKDTALMRRRPSIFDRE